MAYQYRQFCQCGYDTPWEPAEKDRQRCPKCNKLMRRMKDFLEGSESAVVTLEERVKALEKELERVKDAVAMYLQLKEI